MNVRLIRVKPQCSSVRESLEQQQDDFLHKYVLFCKVSAKEIRQDVTVTLDISV